LSRCSTARAATSSARRRAAVSTASKLSLAKTLSGGQAVDLSALIRRQSPSMISTLLHLLRLFPFLCGGARHLALENLALRQQLAVYQRTASRPKLRRSDRLFWVWLLEKDAPDMRPIERPEAGTIVQIPEVGGLHHRYVRRAA